MQTHFLPQRMRQIVGWVSAAPARAVFPRPIIRAYPTLRGVMWGYARDQAPGNNPRARAALTHPTLLPRDLAQEALDLLAQMAGRGLDRLRRRQHRRGRAAGLAGRAGDL